LIAIVYICNLNLVYFNNWFIILLMGCVWIPQIYRNTVKGIKDTPSVHFAAIQSIHALYLPVYFKSMEGNVLFTQPNPLFFYFICIWTMVQIGVLKLQRNKPRFLLPKCWRPHIIPDYYRYERTFDSAVDCNSA
jgi:hypothetical protein